MRAVVQDRYGEPSEVLRVREIGIPTPGPGEVRVRVRAATVHADIWHAVTGYPRMMRLMRTGLRRPRQPVPGLDMAGIVEAAGSGADRFSPGDEVFGETHRGIQWIHGGAFAEYVCADQNVLARKPEGVTFEQAASVATAGMIALINLRGRLEAGPGQRVLINGAGGGVGGVALQVAKTRGAFVVGVDRTEKLDCMVRLGADEVVDYTREDVTRREGGRFHLVFDVASTLSYSDCRRILEPDGKYVIIGHDHFGRLGRRTLGSLPHMLGLMLRGLFDRHLRGAPRALGKGEAMETLKGMLEEGLLTPVVARTCSLEEVPEALRSLADESLCGRIVVVP